MSQENNLSDQDRWLAAEYALGVLGRSQMLSAHERFERDAVFRKAVEGWNTQLSPLLEEVDEVRPPSTVWREIENKILPPQVEIPQAADGIGFWKLISAFTSTVAVACVGLLMYTTGGDFAGTELSGARQELAAARKEANSTATKLETMQTEVASLTKQLQTSKNQVLAEQDKAAEANEELAGLRDQLSSGQLRIETVQQELETAQKALDAANQQVARVNRSIQEARPLVASLTQNGDAPAFVAQYDPLKKALLIRTEVSDSDEKVPEVWLIPAQGEREGEVLSLGVMDEAAPDVLAISDDFIPLVGEGGTLAITMEPPGGAPNGVATGPVIALGKLQAF
ncbi:MAG: anti-sigma factor domain-containing protein [Rhizobiaceae bacterium]